MSNISLKSSNELDQEFSFFFFIIICLKYLFLILSPTKQIIRICNLHSHNSSWIIPKGNPYTHFVYWAVSNPLSFCLSPFESILILHSSRSWDNWKWYFLVLGSFIFLCLESLGLDITSVIFNRFGFNQNGSNIPFVVISFDQKIIWMIDSCEINFWFDRKCFPNSKKFYFWILDFLELDPFDFYIENILNKVIPIY